MPSVRGQRRFPSHRKPAAAAAAAAATATSAAAHLSPLHPPSICISSPAMSSEAHRSTLTDQQFGQGHAEHSEEALRAEAAAGMVTERVCEPNAPCQLWLHCPHAAHTICAV